MTNTVNLDRAAMILVEAAFFGDKRTARKWEISHRTIQNYRTRLNTDSDFEQLFTIKRQQYEQDWIRDIPIAVRSGIQWLSQAFHELEPTAENIYAIAGAVKILTEIGLTKELIDARLGRFDNENRETNNEMVRGLPSSPTD